MISILGVVWWVLTSSLRSAGWAGSVSVAVSTAVFCHLWLAADATVDDYACTTDRSRFMKRCILAFAGTLQWWSKHLQIVVTMIGVAGLGVRMSTGMVVPKPKPAASASLSQTGGSRSIEALLASSLKKARKAKAPTKPLPPGVPPRPAIRAPPPQF